MEQTVPQNGSEPASSSGPANPTAPIRPNVPESPPVVNLSAPGSLSVVRNLTASGGSATAPLVFPLHHRHASAGAHMPTGQSALDGKSLTSLGFASPSSGPIGLSRPPPIGINTDTSSLAAPPKQMPSSVLSSSPQISVRTSGDPVGSQIAPSQLSRAQKFKLLGPLLPCCEIIKSPDSTAQSVCTCAGWRPSTPRLSTQIISGTDPEDEPCSICKHLLSQHGDLNSSKDTLDRKITLLFELNNAVKHEKTAPPEEKSEWQHKISHLKSQLMRPMQRKLMESGVDVLKLKRPEERRITQAPEPAYRPDETPTISQIIRDLAVNKYSERSANPRRLQMEKVCKTFLSVANGLDLPDPQTHARTFPDDTQYPIFYQKWVRFSSEAPASAKLPKRPSDYFGKSMLQVILPHIVKSLKDFMHPVDRDEILPVFIQDLQNILKTDLPVPPEFMGTKVAHDPWQEAKSNLEVLGKRKQDLSESSTKKSKSASSPSETPIPSALPGTCEIDSQSNLEKVMTEEMKGALHFRVIRNDGKPQSLLFLLQLKTIFSKQLPKMPRDYISRLVFDKSHKSLCVMKDDTVMGGITYKPFYPHKLAEIAFCAITSTEQVKGYGTHLMNHLKEHVKTESIEHFLTYADNYAIGYFKKQGFSTEITLDTKMWQGYIKDYDGGTLMHCRIINEVNYLEVPKLLAKQREVLMAKLKELTRSHIVYPGIAQFNKKETIHHSIVPGLRDSGWKPVNRIDPAVLQPLLRIVLEKLKISQHAWPFLEPVDGTQVPDYHEIIKNPMDLSLMEERLNRGTYYIKVEIFSADFNRMMVNCKTYNHVDTPYYTCAELLEQEFKTYMAHHVYPVLLTVSSAKPDS